MRKRTIELGQALVDELGLGDGVDTLSRWMAHYVAEQMSVAKHASGEQKEAAEERCFETILKLWERRASFPGGKRPFERFDMVFRALERLAPGSRSEWSGSMWLREDSEDADAPHSEVKEWLDAAHSVDDCTRVLIRYCLSRAYDSAATDEVKTWLRKANHLESGDDTTAIEQLAALTEEFGESNEKEGGREFLREELETTVACLGSLKKGAQLLLDELPK